MNRRAQTSLPALAIALLLLAGVTGFGLAASQGALASADRDPADRRVASSLASRLVDASSPVTDRRNVVDVAELERLDAAAFARRFPVARDAEAIRVRVGDRSVLSTGDPKRGVTVRRLVAVRHRESRTLRPDLGFGNAVTLPRRTDRATLSISPPAGSSVRTVRANDRVVLHDPGGVNGTFDVALSRYETTRLRFAGTGPLPRGSVVVEYTPAATTKSTLSVTADV